MKGFKCKDCGSTRLEEVLPNTTLFSEVDSVEIIDGEVIVSYMPRDHMNTEGGDSESVYYQCLECGNEVLAEELQKIAEKNKND